MEKPIQIYAELLSNIRAISLVITLQTESNKETKATLSADGQTMTVSHEGYSASIALPTQMEGGGTATLALPAAPAKNLTLRLQLHEKEPGLLKLEEFNGGNEVPWSASDMSSASVMCKKCEAVVLDQNAVLDWRDLPNDDWAEMMDLWHCHKPHDDDLDSHHHETADSKGYAASNRLTVSAGVGFVSLSYFLLSERDCQNIKTNKSNADHQNVSLQISCTSCNSSLGVEDVSSGGIKLSKWSVSIRKISKTESHPIEKWFTAQLLSAIENEGLRRFLIKQEEDDSSSTANALLLWVFTDDLNFSSSVDDHEKRQDPTRAMKILWKSVSSSKDAAQSAHLTIEHIYFPKLVFAQVAKTLAHSNGLLPVASRTFQDWQVGLVERFRIGDFKSA